MARASDAEHTAQDDRDPWNCGLIYSGQRTTTDPNRSCPFGRAANEESGLIDEVHDWQMKRIEGVNQLDNLVAGRGIKPAAPVNRFACDHATRKPVQSR